MHVSTPAPQDDPPAREPRRSRVVLAVLTALAFAVQVLVLLFTFAMGLGWGGLTYVAAVLQAALAFVLIVRLSSRSSPVVVLVPVLSAALTGALAFAGQAHGRATACSEQERAAVQRLAAPPGTTVQFEGEYVEGCVARTRMGLPSRTIVEHYEAEFSRLGWRLTPGRHEATVGTAAQKDGVSVVVDVNTAGEGGAETLEVVTGDGASGPRCATNTVDGFQQRTPTTAVEPGTWSMLVSTEEEPATVLVRDSTSAVVFEQTARRRPGISEDTLRVEDLPDEVDTLTLEQGVYQVECRPQGAAATTVPLRVVWDSAPGAEREKDVVLRVFETPEQWE